VARRIVEWCIDEPSTIEAARLVLGLQSLSSEHQEVIELVASINRLLENTTLEPTSEAKAAVAMSGLRRMRHYDDPQILRLIAQVTRILRACRPESVSSQETAMLIGSLRLLGPVGSHGEISRMLKEIVRLASLCSEPLTRRGAHMVADGVRCLHRCNDPESIGLVKVAQQLLSRSNTDDGACSPAQNKRHERDKRFLALAVPVYYESPWKQNTKS
jgi:hypothetical protein